MVVFGFVDHRKPKTWHAVMASLIDRRKQVVRNAVSPGRAARSVIPDSVNWNVHVRRFAGAFSGKVSRLPGTGDQEIRSETRDGRTVRRGGLPG
jgi:hypothetical protein